MNDWGIHHLHLGTEVDERTGLMKRTGPVLYVRFDNNCAYFIQIMDHGEWANDELIKIMHNNWPDSIKDYLLKDVKFLKPKISNKDRLELRKAGISTFVEIAEDIIYMPMGGGYASSDHNTMAVMQCNRTHNTLRMMETHIKDNIHKFIESIRTHTDYRGNDIEFILNISDSDNKVHVIEKNSGVSFFLGKW